jgi:hypothetical protein
VRPPMRAKSRIWAKISELVSQGFFGGCFHRQGPTIYNISTALVCEKRRAKGSFLRVQWGLTANARWRRVAQQEARTTQLRAPEQSLAARNVRRGKRRSQLVTKRIVTGSPRGQPRFSPCGRPPPGISDDTPMGAVASHTALLPEKRGIPEPHPGIRNRS